MKRIAVVGSQHGDELLGEQLFAYIEQQPKNERLQVDFLLANPRARKLCVRFVESDMNRSYRQGRTTYEARRASQLAARLRRANYDLVIDAHTTTVDQQDCVIVPAISADNVGYLAAAHINNVVVMQHEFVHDALIGAVPRVVSVEVSKNSLSDALFARLYGGLAAYVAEERPRQAKSVFVVTELLERGSLPNEAIQSLKNFTRCSAGFYPVLVGEEAYRKHTKYLGFKATTRQQVRL